MSPRRSDGKLDVEGCTLVDNRVQPGSTAQMVLGQQFYAIGAHSAISTFVADERWKTWARNESGMTVSLWTEKHKCPGTATVVSLTLTRTTRRIWGLTPFFGRFRPKMGCLTPIALHRNAPMNRSPNRKLAS